MRQIIAWSSWALVLAVGVGCTQVEQTDAASEGIREDTSRAPQIVHVPVRFTQNDVSDVGYSFSSSWVPLVGVARDHMDGYSWGISYPSTAEDLIPWYVPDRPGAGYATAYFDVEVPYDTTGQLAYGLARVKLDSEFLQTQMATTIAHRYSPLRVRSGSDQPCLSITMSGQLDGKLKAVPLPYTDQGFTERDWNIGDTDGSGVPISKVILGTLRFAPYCWPTNVEGSTQASGGIAAPPGAFIMVGKDSGQGQSDSAVVFVNLLENTQGKVSVGDVFSTDAAMLGDRDRAAFDQAVTAFATQFASDVQNGVNDYTNSLSAGE
jgi:hypothetical protein